MLSPTTTINLERQVAEWRHGGIEGLPPHLKQLAAIVRRAVLTGRLGALDRWCKRHELRVTRRQLRPFRDYLVTRLLELSDLEPEARARLRQDQLRGQAKGQMTEDYRRGTERGEDLRCRNCRYFVTAPDDGDPSDPHRDKACVALGTKGSDAACFGYRVAAGERTTGR